MQGDYQNNTTVSFMWKSRNVLVKAGGTGHNDLLSTVRYK